MKDTPVLFINPDKASAIKVKKHPWIFDGAVTGEEKQIRNGELVEVLSVKSGTVGYGLYCKYSKIRVRMVSYGVGPLPDSWISERIRSAAALRRSLNIDSNAFRLVNGEGDFLPGLVVDVYQEVTVVRPLVRYLELRIDEIAAVLRELFPGNAIYLKRDEHACRNEHLELVNGFIHGEARGRVIIEEHGMRFVVDVENGQKTGFYLDQRENRKTLSLMSKDMNVCNLFCYTGAFSVAACNGGAKHVLSVDSSKGAIAMAMENAELSGCDTSRFEWLCEDVFDVIEKTGTHDIIVLDPPPFARKKSELEGAIAGYRHLNEKALCACSHNGFLFTFSCSGAVSPEHFRDTVRDASLRAGRNVRIVRELHADVDHTVSLVHPEGEYLKGLILHVE